MFVLSYRVLRVCQLKGMRNGNWRVLDRVQRGFYRACIVYARLKGTIVNPKMVSLLRELMDKLRSTMKARALKAATKEVDRVARIYFKAGVFKWAPQLKAWLHDEVYKFWLVLTKLNSPIERV